MKHLLITLLFLFALNEWARTQPYVVKLNVITTAINSQESLKGVKVIVNRHSQEIVKPNRRGEFELLIEKNAQVQFTFFKEGYLPKTISVNTLNTPDMKKLKEFNIQLLLVPKKEGIRYAEFNDPMVKIEYNTSTKKIDYNKAYNANIHKYYTQYLLSHEKEFSAQTN